MNKFSCLVIKSDLSIQRVWLSPVSIIAMLKDNADMAIYRNHNDQEAVVQDGQLVWVDVPLEDTYINE